MKFEGKNVGIVGLGKSGYWASKLAKNLHYNVFVSDTNSNIDKSMIDDLENLGVEIELGKHTNKILNSDIIIKSPGISNDISEIEFAGMISNVKNICITGTNGKTTTVSLINQILKEELNVLKSGNIGIPFSQIVLEHRLYDKNDIDYCILELSSFQLEHCSHLKKEISAFINISNDHLDRYESFNDYFNTKLKIFENSNLKDDELNPDDDRLWSIMKYLRNGGTYEDVSRKTSIDPWFTFSLEKIVKIEKRLMNKKLTKNLLLEAN